jgi:pyrroline-5-carboxylate reductase
MAELFAAGICKFTGRLLILHGIYSKMAAKETSASPERCGSSSMEKKIGFIGTGNMGSALARAAAGAGYAEQMYLANRTFCKAHELAGKLGAHAADSVWIAKSCHLIFLGVKPQMMAQLLAQLQPALANRKDSFALVSMAAGLTMDQIRDMAGGNYPVIRIMPNTPVAVGQGVVMYDATENVTEDLLTCFLGTMAKAGLVDRLPESLLDAGSALAGCGPAFACLFMEALADGGVACGLPRKKAMEYAAQMLLGTAALAQGTGEHSGQMKDAVCSPGGLTIKGVAALERGGFRAAVIDAIDVIENR